MNHNPAPNSTPIPILEVAWRHFAELDDNSFDLSRRHLNLRRLVFLLGVIVTFLAILTDSYGARLSALGGLALKFFLVLTPIAGSVLAAYLNKFYSRGDWLALRAGAEEILKEIYVYRTILQNSPQRRIWLEKRMAEIQRQVYKALGGEMVIRSYKGKIPPYYNPDKEGSDPGFSDLTGEEYFNYRMQDQLNWHVRKVAQYQRERTRLQLALLAMGGGGALLAALGGGLSVWVALTASIAAALSGWDELRNLDATVRNYSKVIIELKILTDHWRNLEPEERTQIEFYDLVRNTEEILWGQNVDYIRSMQEALIAARGEDADLVEQVLRQSIAQDAEFKRQITASVVGATGAQAGHTFESAHQTFEGTLGTISDEASSELVAQELEAMGAAINETLQAAASGVSATLQNLAAEFANLSLTRETPKEVVNSVLTRYPTTGELKG